MSISKKALKTSQKDINYHELNKQIEKIPSYRCDIIYIVFINNRTYFMSKVLSPSYGLYKIIFYFAKYNKNYDIDNLLQSKFQIPDVFTDPKFSDEKYEMHKYITKKVDINGIIVIGDEYDEKLLNYYINLEDKKYTSICLIDTNFKCFTSGQAKTTRAKCAELRLINIDNYDFNKDPEDGIEKLYLISSNNIYINVDNRWTLSRMQLHGLKKLDMISATDSHFIINNSKKIEFVNFVCSNSTFDYRKIGYCCTLILKNYKNKLDIAKINSGVLYVVVKDCKKIYFSKRRRLSFKLIIEDTSVVDLRNIIYMKKNKHEVKVKHSKSMKIRYNPYIKFIDVYYDVNIIGIDDITRNRELYNYKYFENNKGNRFIKKIIDKKNITTDPLFQTRIHREADLIYSKTPLVVKTREFDFPYTCDKVQIIKNKLESILRFAKCLLHP